MYTDFNRLSTVTTRNVWHIKVKLRLSVQMLMMCCMTSLHDWRIAPHEFSNSLSRWCDSVVYWYSTVSVWYIIAFRRIGWLRVMLWRTIVGNTLSRSPTLSNALSLLLIFCSSIDNWQVYCDGVIMCVFSASFSASFSYVYQIPVWLFQTFVQISSQASMRSLICRQETPSSVFCQNNPRNNCLLTQNISRWQLWTQISPLLLSRPHCSPAVLIIRLLACEKFCAVRCLVSLRHRVTKDIH